MDNSMTDLNYQLLDKELDKVKTKVFLGSNAAFLGPLMCSVNFLWTEDIMTAQTNGISLYWNPHWFLKLPFDTRVTVLLHELWHIALLHMLRRGTRDPEIWNYACVPAGTMVAMADGTEKPIEIMEAGDQIKNVEDGTSTVACLINSTYKEILEIELEDGRILLCTPEHRILTEGGFKTAAQLTIGSSCFVDKRYGNIPTEPLGD